MTISRKCTGTVSNARMTVFSLSKLTHHPCIKRIKAQEIPMIVLKYLMRGIAFLQFTCNLFLDIRFARIASVSVGITLGCILLRFQMNRITGESIPAVLIEKNHSAAVLSPIGNSSRAARSIQQLQKEKPAVEVPQITIEETLKPRLFLSNSPTPGPTATRRPTPSPSEHSFWQVCGHLPAKHRHKHGTS